MNKSGLHLRLNRHFVGSYYYPASVMMHVRDEQYAIMSLVRQQLARAGRARVSFKGFSILIRSTPTCAR